MAHARVFERYPDFYGIEKRDGLSLLPSHHEKDARRPGAITMMVAPGRLQAGLATGVPDAAAAGVPAADGTATVPCAPGAGVADDAGVGAVVPGSATVKVMVLIQVNWSGTPT